jgi:hypothetical protein
MCLLSIRQHDFLPNICFRCAQPAQKMVQAQASNVDALVSIKRLFVTLSFPVVTRLFAAFDAANRDMFLSVKIPICKTCKKQRIKPEIQSYDLEYGNVRIVVHEAFRKAFEQERARP